MVQGRDSVTTNSADSKATNERIKTAIRNRGGWSKLQSTGNNSGIEAITQATWKKLQAALRVNQTNSVHRTEGNEMMWQSIMFADLGFDGSPPEPPEETRATLTHDQPNERKNTSEQANTSQNANLES
jgi:hypothetical protein